MIQLHTKTMVNNGTLLYAWIKQYMCLAFPKEYENVSNEINIKTPCSYKIFPVFCIYNIQHLIFIIPDLKIYN